MKDKFFLLVGLAIIFGSFYLFLQKPAPAHLQTGHFIKIGDKVVKVEVADTPELRGQGLSGRESLNENTGMLFVFSEIGNYGFWMKNMNFVIDIVWIDEGWKVVGVERLVNPDTFPQVFYPPSAVKYVLELPVGNAATLLLDTGSILYFDTPN